MTAGPGNWSYDSTCWLRLAYTSPARGGDRLRKVEVTAYPTIGGRRGKQALIVWFMNPVFRGLTSNSSMALHTVGVSKLASAARRSVEKAGNADIGFPDSRNGRPFLHRVTRPAVPRRRPPRGRT